MAIYKYRAKKGSEPAVDGRLEAVSEKMAVEILSQTGYVPIRIELENQPNASLKVLPRAGYGKIRASEITAFSRQMASLLKSGVPILKAIDIIREQSENTKLKYLLTGMYTEIKGGATFSSCLMKYPKIFSPIYAAIVHSGEDSGALPEVLFRLADYRSKQEEMVSRFRMALAYPIFMALVGVSTIIFMLTFVMPRLMHLFISMGQKLPLPTRILIFISSNFQKWWWLIAAGVVGGITSSRRYLKTEAGKIFLSAFSLRLPLFGRLILKNELARFSRTMELLIKNGITILKAIMVAIPVIENEIIKTKLRISYKELEQGGSLGKSLKSAKVFPLFMSNLISVGEESGRLDGAFGELANAYEHDTDEAIRIMSSLLEPVMILVIGLIVGFIVMAMLLPVFEINMMAG